MIKLFIRNHVILATIEVFFSLFSLLVITKPKFIFNRDGTLKEFGLGYTKKTVLPIWLIAILLAIMSYFTIIYYINWNKLHPN